MARLVRMFRPRVCALCERRWKSDTYAHAYDDSGDRYCMYEC